MKDAYSEVRKQRGLEIAALSRIEKVGEVYKVPSQYAPWPTKYDVCCSGDKATCTCQDFETRKRKCKHIFAVEYSIRREQHPDGSETVTENVTITKTRKTYPQNWTAYNEAQTNEKREFQVLLHNLCRNLTTPEQEGRGQRRLPMSDAVFSVVYKVYSMMSARRFTSDLCDAQAKGFIDKVPHFNSVLNYLESPELFEILKGMIVRSSLPLRSVESDFAVDSTGFTTCRFVRWYDVKYNKFTAEQQWIKLHFCTGVKTNIVTAVEIHDMYAGDAPQLPPLVKKTAENFTMKEVSADKAYSGRESHDAIAAAGATPFIMFKENATGGVGGLFEKMFHFFEYKRSQFLSHYHKRSNVESTVMMIKTKFGDSLKSKTETAQKNETLAKVLCHNICCLIQAKYELGLDADFFDEAAQQDDSCTTEQRK